MSIYQQLAKFDSPTIFNAVDKYINESKTYSRDTHSLMYTDKTIKCLLPELGSIVGKAVTAEVTTNDPDSKSIPWDDYYSTLEDLEGPIVSVIKDVDSNPGRGACFGDGMAYGHKMLGVTGAIVDGTVRDLYGIKEAGLPIWANGLVPGHGTFNLISVNSSLTIGSLRIQENDILVADINGCTKIPKEFNAEEILNLAVQIRGFEQNIFEIYQKPNMTYSEARKEINQITK
ncbi:MAG: hypothetical protein CL768_02810 [Chloroflexi bacterium]|nr:hypothetical protein [Chloroflexota bacterium]|tara:strand:+ start:259 stop:951 length:693 start_codon:yes stop_codon:yes gene_type:complete